MIECLKNNTIKELNMKIEKVYTKNATYQKFEVLKTNRNKRYKFNEFFVEGVRNINEAVKNGWTINSFIYTFEKPLSSWAKYILSTVNTPINYELTNDLMIELSNKEDTSELLAIIKMKEDKIDQLHLSSKPFIALFDRPSNKGNLGTIIRSCDACGVNGLIITGHAVDLYDPEVIVSSMGSFFNVDVIRIASNDEIFSFISQMKEKYPDFQAIGTTSHKKNVLSDVDLNTPLLIMIGNETEGLSQALTKNADILATIPMSEQSSASSFNVACASSIIFYEVIRQRDFIFK
jgi:TrmH family RNA methyltransferase